MPGGAGPIRDRQNDPAMISLLRAMSVVHVRAQRLDHLSALLSVLLAVFGLVAAFIPAAATTAIVLGGVWALAYSVGLGSWARREVVRAALIQEMFDVRLFELPWNDVAVGQHMTAPETARLSRLYRGRADMVEDYYEIPDLPKPYDVLACQQQNLGWGSRVRRRYAQAVVGGVVLWACAGIVVGAVAGLGVVALFLRWYVPSLSLFLHGIDTFRGQRAVAEERERVLSVVRSRVEHSARGPQTKQVVADLLVLARQVQDVIFQTRRRQIRVPNWFFLRFRSRDRADFQEVVKEITAAVGTGARSGT